MDVWKIYEYECKNIKYYDKRTYYDIDMYIYLHVFLFFQEL